MSKENKFRNIISNKDSHFKIKIEDISEFENSFFRDVYEETTKNLQDIIDNNIQYYELKGRGDDDYSKFKYIDKEEKNNIIAFAGERGAGKTSAMISFAGALSSKNKDQFEPMSNLKDKEFWVLNSIDPSLFEDNESIFQVVIAKLFETFRSEIHKKPNEINEQSEIIRAFEKVYKNFKVISSGARYNDNISLDDTLEALSNLAASSSMRENFMNLVKLLLEYKYEKSNIDKSYLVLSIDDLDMNITKSSDMAEQIRKYLLIPNVIILMAVKVEQLSDSIEQMFRKEYEVMRNSNIELEDDPKNMAARYIEKLIPNGRKVYLPNFKLGDSIDKVRVQIKANSGDTVDNIDGIQECVLGMIYRKTGLIFVKPNEEVHLLIPDNMRELQNLLAILTNLKDIEFYVNQDRSNNESFVGIQAKNKQDLIKNVEIFEKYFYSTWLKRNLDSKDINIIEEFRLKPIEYKNKFIIGKLAEKKILENTDSKINKIEKSEFGEYVEIKNKSYNMSLGDVLDVLDINKDYDSENMKKLKFAIKTVYSLEIHKRLYFEEYNETDTLDEGTEIGINSHCSKGINDIYKLSAGNILGRIYNELTRKPQKHRGIQGWAVWKINEYNKMPILINYENKLLEFPLDALIKFLHPPANDENRIENLIKGTVKISPPKEIDQEKLKKYQDEPKKYPEELKRYQEELKRYPEELEKSKEQLKKCIESDTQTFELKCKSAIKLVHNFIYQGLDLKDENNNKTNNYRINDDKYYDIKVNIANKSSVFSVYAFLTKALKVNSIYESLVELRDKKLKRNDADTTEAMIEDIDKNDSYVMLPLNSIEALEYIKEYLYKYRNKYLYNKYPKGKYIDDKLVYEYDEYDEYFKNIVKTSYKLLYNSLEHLTNHIDYIGDKDSIILEQIKSFPLNKYFIEEEETTTEAIKEFDTMENNINLIRLYSEKFSGEIKKIKEEKFLLEEVLGKLKKCKTKSTNNKMPTYPTLRKKWNEFTPLINKHSEIKKYVNKSNLYKLINEGGKENISLLRSDALLREKFYYEFEDILDITISRLKEEINILDSNIENIGE